MATVQVQNLLERASTIIQDTTGTRWPEAELLWWLNDAQREIVLHRPDALSVNERITVTGGQSKQNLPNDALMLIDILRNVTVAADGTVTSGDVIRRTERRVLDDQVPGWHSQSAGSIDHFVYDERDPKTFYVYPGLEADGHIEGVISKAPTDVAVGDTITLDDIYANPMLDYILHRAYSKDADYAANAQRAVAHMTAFLNSLGVKTKSDAATKLMGTTNDGVDGNAVVPKT